MKTYKKIIFGLCLLISLTVGGLFAFSHKAAALTQNDFKQPPATYNLVGTSSISATLGGNVAVTFDNNGTNPTAKNLIFTPDSTSFIGGQFCAGSQITMPNQTPPGSTAQINVKWVNTGSNGSCNSNPPFVGPQSYSGKITLTSAGVPPPTNTSGSTSTCESNFVSPFAWIVCPVLNLADSIIGSAYGQVENQLCFNTGSSSTGGIQCNGPNSLVDGVKSAWSIFKNIASALLVIVMLVMVFSQAIGGGPFDAYTVRKMLPKLVAAVILMQLSWLLLKFAIDISNDLGSAIGKLMMAPFGGPNNMSLGNMIGNGVHVATGSTAGQAAFDVFATIATIGAFIYAIPALPLLALYVIVGVFIAFFVLVLRKLLIIMLVILAPVAFVCWILPGTERYWKMWSDNFLKLLAMFPLIMALLSAGRIFAYITSKSGNGASMFSPHLAVAHIGRLPVPYFGSATGFADLAIIIGAFFAPYFLLPKTFSWGGQALGAAGKAVENMTNKAAESPKKFLQTREEGYRAERRRKSQERLSGKRPYGGIGKVWQKPIDNFRSGKLDPTLGMPRLKIPEKSIGGKKLPGAGKSIGGSRRRFEATSGYSAAGRESSGKTAETAKNAAQQLFDTAADHDAVAQMLARGGQFDYIDKAGNKRTYKPPAGGEDYMIAAGFAGIGKYGTDGSNRVFQAELDRLRAKGGKHALLAEEILDDNVGSMKGKMDSMYRGFNRSEYQRVMTDKNLKVGGRDATDAERAQMAIRAARIGSVQSSVESMKDDWFGGMEAVEAQSLLAGLSQDISSTDAGAQADQRRAKSRGLMKKLWQDYQTAVANPNIHIAPGVHKAFKAYADENITTDAAGKEVNGLQQIKIDRENEVNTRLRGDLVKDDGTIERVDTTLQVREAPVLDVINRDATNVELIDEIGARTIMSRFDANGAPIRTAPAPGSQTVGSTAPGQASQGAGVINITHEQDVLRQSVPVPEDMINTPDSSGWTPRDYANAENQARGEYNHLRGLGVRTPEQEQRFQYYRSNFPNW
jgi:hypothetical protein